MAKRESDAQPTSSSDFKGSSFDRSKLDPKLIAQSFLAKFDQWRFSRTWGAAAFGIVPLVILASVFGIVLWGNTFAAGNLLNNYLEAAEAAAPVKEDGTGADEELKSLNEADTPAPSDSVEAQKSQERQELADYAFLLYQRVLAQEANNKRAKYYVAAQMAQRGDLAKARSMMDALAPDETDGYPAAHAWKAYDLLRSSAISQQKVDEKLLEHHLELASRWAGTNPQLLIQRARMLEEDGKINQALAMYSIAADRDPNFKLLLASAFRRHNQPARTQEAIQSAITYYSRNLNTEEEKTEDRMKVAEAHLLNNEVLKAVSVLEEGLIRRENKAEYRRAISQVLRSAYLSTAQLDQSSFKANLVLLDRAIEADPANPNLQVDLNNLTALLAQPNAIEDSIKSLNEQLASATAPLLSHLLLANLHFIKQAPEIAQLHWDLALKINPNIVVALRSYALSLALQPEPEYPKALELIERAIVQSDSAPEVLDAKGDILMRLDRVTEAVDTYQAAVLKSPMMTVQTRKKLVSIYTDQGENDKANREMKFVELIERRMEEIRNQQMATQNAKNSQANSDDALIKELQLDDQPLADEALKLELNAAEEEKPKQDEGLEALIQDLQGEQPQTP